MTIPLITRITNKLNVRRTRKVSIICGMEYFSQDTDNFVLDTLRSILLPMSRYFRTGTVSIKK